MNLKSKPKVHLIVTVFLTDLGLMPIGFYGDNVSPSQNKVNQFLSSMHTLSGISISSSEFHVAFSDEYKEQVNLVNARIRLLFPNSELSNNRFESFNEWEDSTRKIPIDAEFILLFSNHDHVYLGDGPRNFDLFVNNLRIQKDCKMGLITHWPEVIGSPSISLRKKRGQSCLIDWKDFAIGTVLIKKDFYLDWWANDFTSGARIVRPDNPFGPSVTFRPVPVLVPRVELFRHLDGYGHVGVRADIAAPLKTCCGVLDGQIVHEDWSRGNFLASNQTYDLPIQPQDTRNVTICEIQNLVLLSNSYRISLKNSYLLLLSYSHRLSLLFPYLIFKMVGNKEFRQRLFKRLFEKSHARFKFTPNR